MSTYNVVIFGPQGSGKTVYLASLYRRLSTPAELGYYLSVPLPQSKTLNHLYTDLVTGWPRATGIERISTWNFDVSVSNDTGAVHRAVNIDYFDYAGSRATENQVAEIEAETETMIGKAHVLLGLLDGEKLHEELRFGKRDEVFWNVHVHELCVRMQRAQHKSVHFLVSKWDLFEDSDQSLQEVRSLLEGYPPFKNVVESRKRTGGITRLIPVSSVGYGYCQLQGDTMVKRAGGIPNPFQVEVPFACVLPDLIQTELKKAADAAEQRAVVLARPVYVKLSFWESLKLSFGRVISKISEVTGLKDPIIDWLIKTAPLAAERKKLAAEEQNRLHQQEADQLWKKVKDENSAVIFVLNSMANSVTMLERAYPSSRIE